MVFRWRRPRTTRPLYTNLSAEDASAVVDELDAQGVPYELSDGGATVMVPRDQVYATRIALSGEGLPRPARARATHSSTTRASRPRSSRSRPTSSGRWRASSPRPSRRSTASTPRSSTSRCRPKQVFADEQDPTTASVLVETAPGHRPSAPSRCRRSSTSSPPASTASTPSKVTVADATGRRALRAEGGALGASTRDQQVADFEAQEGRTSSRRCSTASLGPGNSTVQVTADLDFDKAVTETTTYEFDPDRRRSRSRRSTEKYNGPAAGADTARAGVVGPDGQMDDLAAAGDRGLQLQQGVDHPGQRDRQGRRAPRERARRRRRARTSASSSTPPRSRAAAPPTSRT